MSGKGRIKLILKSVYTVYTVQSLFYSTILRQNHRESFAHTDVIIVLYGLFHVPTDVKHFPSMGQCQEQFILLGLHAVCMFDPCFVTEDKL